MADDKLEQGSRDELEMESGNQVEESEHNGSLGSKYDQDDSVRLLSNKTSPAASAAPSSSIFDSLSSHVDCPTGDAGTGTFSPATKSSHNSDSDGDGDGEGEGGGEEGDGEEEGDEEGAGDEEEEDNEEKEEDDEEEEDGEEEEEEDDDSVVHRTEKHGAELIIHDLEWVATQNPSHAAKIREYVDMLRSGDLSRSQRREIGEFAWRVMQEAMQAFKDELKAWVQQ